MKTVPAARSRPGAQVQPGAAREWTTAEAAQREIQALKPLWLFAGKAARVALKSGWPGFMP